MAIKTDLLSLLNSRLLISKKFHKKWFESVKKWLKSYEIDSMDGITDSDLHNKLQIPYIFSTVESALPSMFNTFPQLIMKGRGKDDQDFGDFVSDVWSYVYDKTLLEEKIENAGTMFLITGIGQIGLGWITETEKVTETTQQPITHSDGSPVIDPATGQPATQEVQQVYEVATKDMPLVDFKHYKKILYSPESEFVVDDVDNKIPYIFECKKMSPDEIYEKYQIKISDKTYMDVKEIDSDLNIEDDDLLKEDLERNDVYIYQGNLPKNQVKDDNWKSNRIYEVVFTSKKILQDPKQISKKKIFQMGNYGVPTKFFKFGEPYILADLEKEVSYGVSTLIDYRDKFTTKVAVPSDTEFDERAFKSPKKFAVVRYAGQRPPEYITPPPLPEIVMQGIQESQQFIQMTSAQLDIGRGGQSSTVNTATGQKIFQQAQDARIERKRRKIAKFIEAIARQLLLDCSEQWDADVFAKIVDVDKNDPQAMQQLTDFVTRLKGLGDDFDIQIEPESVVSNKETQGAQAIALYRETIQDPMVNHGEVLKETIKTGFGKKDVDRFIKTPDQLAQEASSVKPPPPNVSISIKADAATLAGQELLATEGIKIAPTPTPLQQTVTGKVGRPASANPVDILKKSMPGADNTQISAQGSAAYKQTGVAKGPQNT